MGQVLEITVGVPGITSSSRSPCYSQLHKASQIVSHLQEDYFVPELGGKNLHIYVRQRRVTPNSQSLLPTMKTHLPRQKEQFVETSKTSPSPAHDQREKRELRTYAACHSAGCESGLASSSVGGLTTEFRHQDWCLDNHVSQNSRLLSTS